MQFIYLFDPLCGFCYASSKGIATFAKTHDIDIYATGLFANTGKIIDPDFANYAWANDMRISQMTGLPFSEKYRALLLQGGKFDSFYLTTACALLKELNANELLSTLSSFQKMRYVDGLDTSDLMVVKNGLITLGYADIAEKLDNADSKMQANNWIKAGQKFAQQFNISGVPSLIAKTDKGYAHIPSQFLYQDTDNVVENIGKFLNWKTVI